MKFESLDEIDHQLLFELDKNSRINISLLSKKLKISRDRISYRLKRYQDLGILKRCTVTVDPYKFGLCVYKTYLKLGNDKKRRAQLIDSFQKRTEIYWFAETEGQWDAIFAVYARSLFEFNLIQDEILEEFSDLVQEFQVSSLVDAWFFRKNYLVQVGSGYFKIGGKPEYSETDNKDIEILSILAEDARASVVEIGERINASSTLVNTRIAKMEKSGIIVGYRTELDLALLGISSFKSRLYVNQYDRDSLSILFDYARLNPNLTLLMRQVGDCKVEVEFDVQNYDHYMLCVDDLREKFPKLIHHIETIALKKQAYQWMSLQTAKRSDGFNQLIGELSDTDEKRDFLMGR